MGTCLVPKNGNKYNTELADKFETVMRKSYQLVGSERPRTLKKFINKGDDGSFDVVETNEYEAANYVFSQLDFPKEFHLFDPPANDDGTFSFDAYAKSKKWIESRGKYDDDHLLEACISAVSQSRVDFEYFSKLFDHYSSSEDGSNLKTQLYATDFESGMCCLHYLALYGDEMLIEKVLVKYDENAVELLYDYDGNNALKYMQRRPEFDSFVEELKPKDDDSNFEEVENPTSTVPTKTLKDRIIDSFNARKGTLVSVEKGAKAQYDKNKNNRRNKLAANDSAYHLRELNDILGRIESSQKNDLQLKQYATDEVEKARKFAASEETRFSNYVLRYDNEYAQYVHRKAKETFGRIKSDI